MRDGPIRVEYRDGKVVLEADVPADQVPVARSMLQGYADELGAWLIGGCRPPSGSG